MRVAFVTAVTTHHRDTDRTRRIEDHARTLQAQGHEVVVVCARWWEGDHPLFEADGLTYRGVASDPSAREFTTGVPTAVDNFEPDVVHAVGDVPAHLLAARAGATLARAPLVADWWTVPDPTGSGVSGFVDRRTFDLARHAPAVHVVPSRLVRTDLRAAGVPADDIRVVPTGVEWDLVQSVNPVERGDVAYSRTLDADANLESLLLALAEFRERDWRAVVLGDGPERENYETQVRDLRIDDRVTFAGARPVEERIASFKAAHVYVHTAHRAMFPTDLLRALACGCVGVVAYHEDSAAHELVEQYGRGFLATGDEEIVDALGDAGTMARRETEDAFAEYDRESVCDTYLELYDEVRAAHGFL